MCECDKPWKGDGCGVIGYAVTPSKCKNLYNNSDPENTWNGPIYGPDSQGKYHLYDPLYKEKHLIGPYTTLHGIADDVTGPYDFTTLPRITFPHGNQNPAFLKFPNKTTGKDVYSIWVGGHVHVADNPNGEFTDPGFTYPGGNPAPVYHNGAFYMTYQQTKGVSWGKYLRVQ